VPWVRVSLVRQWSFLFIESWWFCVGAASSIGARLLLSEIAPGRLRGVYLLFNKSLLLAVLFAGFLLVTIY